MTSCRVHASCDEFLVRCRCFSHDNSSFSIRTEAQPPAIVNRRKKDAVTDINELYKLVKKIYMYCTVWSLFFHRVEDRPTVRDRSRKLTNKRCHYDT